MARLSPAQIGMIAAHATGTPDNDAAEYAAFKRVFGDALPDIPVVGFKSHLGHTLGGAGAVELILAMTALREQTVPPCANITPDEVEFPNLRLNTGTAKPTPIRATLNTSLGFGGANTCVILGLPPDRHPEEALPTKDLASNEQLSSPRGRIPSTSSGQALRSAQDDGLARSNGARDVLITGVGVIVPGAIGNDAFISRLASESPPAWLTDGGAIPEDQFIHLLNARRIRRMSDQVKLTLAATAIACQDAAIADLPAFAQTCGAILGSTHGSAHYSLSYYGEIIRQGLVGANPMLFAEGVPNACSAHLSLMLAVKGACQTVIGTRTAALDALRLASLRIAAGDWDRAIVAAAEEYCDVINQTYRCCGLYAGAAGASAPFAGQAGFTTASAAVAFILESRQSLESRGASKARGRILDGASSRGNSDDPAAAAREVLTRLGPAEHAITSANGTWIDRAELAALRKKRDRAVLSSIYGHVPETFSCTPLLGISAALLTGRMPKLRSDGPLQDKGVRAAGGHERPASIIALCTDYTGVVTGMRMGLDVEGGATRQ
jgi:3-oxoacyl-(acyl-carrier-protein) synthase